MLNVIKHKTRMKISRHVQAKFKINVARKIVQHNSL